MNALDAAEEAVLRALEAEEDDLSDGFGFYSRPVELRRIARRIAQRALAAAGVL